MHKFQHSHCIYCGEHISKIESSGCGSSRSESMQTLPFSKKKQIGRPERSNKYNAKKSHALSSPRLFDSKAEADFRDVLAAREKVGEICEIVEQPVINLDSEIKYKPDFSYWELKLADPQCFEPLVDYEKTRQVWVDVKGVETDRFRLIKKLWRYHGPGPLEIVKRKGRNSPFLVTQSIMPIV